MIGFWGAHSSAFLVAVSVFAIALGAPMLLHPIGWARALQWRVPEQTDLAVYFGRCLGGVVTVLGIMGFVAARAPGAQPFFFDLALAAVGVNVLVHAWGAVRKIQPMTETVEIALWVLLFLGGLAFYPA